MSQPAQKLYTLEEYFALEEVAEERHEYYQGYIYAMTGATFDHERITRRLYIALDALPKGKPCEVFTSSIKVLAKQINFAAYPDVSVVCGQIDPAPRRKDTYTNPILLVEVSSRSTRNYDRIQKFSRYMTIPSFKDYLLIEQNIIQVDYFHRLETGGWFFERYTSLEDVIELKALGVSLPLAEIYGGVEFEVKENDEAENTEAQPNLEEREQDVSTSS